MNYAKRWGLAFLLYADKNQDQFPASFDQAAEFFPQDSEDAGDLTPDQFEIVYHGTLRALDRNVSECIVVREKEPRLLPDGTRVKVYGFADGHSERRKEPPEGFDAFERKHIFPQQAP